MAPAQWRRIKITFIAGGIAAAGGVMCIALFRDVTVMTLIELPGFLPLFGGVLLILALDAAVATVRGFERRLKPKSPWRYRALPAEPSEPVGGLVVVKVTALLAQLVATAVTGLAAIAAVPLDRVLAAGLFQAFLLVLVGGAMAGFTLSAALRIERLVRWLLSLPRPISPAPP